MYLYFVQVYNFEKMLLTLYTIVSLYNTKWTLPQTTHLEVMFWVFLFPFFYEDVEFDEIYAFVNEIMFWYKYHHTSTYFYN